MGEGYLAGGKGGSQACWPRHPPRVRFPIRLASRIAGMGWDREGSPAADVAGTGSRCLSPVFMSCVYINTLCSIYREDQPGFSF